MLGITKIVLAKTLSQITGCTDIILIREALTLEDIDGMDELALLRRSFCLKAVRTSAPAGAFVPLFQRADPSAEVPV